MRFQFENLGLLDKADLEISNLTIICGENNTGKTYATYGIYGFLRNIRSYLKNVLRRDKPLSQYFKNTPTATIKLDDLFHNRINDYLIKACEAYTSDLPQAFASPPNLFQNTKFYALTSEDCNFSNIAYDRHLDLGDGDFISLRKTKASNNLEILCTNENLAPILISELIVDAIFNIVFSKHLPQAHISSVERTGAAVFRGELDTARTRFINTIRNNDVHNFSNKHVLKEINSKSSYSWPVEDNVDFARELESIEKSKGEFADKHPEILDAFNKIIGGSYKSASGKIVFQSNDRKDISFSMNQASSSARSLLDVGFYLRCKAGAGDLLIIDEPELSLHPRSQRALARLLAMLVNAGLKIFITTHSDYIIKELNTLIMLNQKTDYTKKIQEKYSYLDNELVDYKKTKLYITEKRVDNERPSISLKDIPIDPAYGIEVKTFDQEIIAMNEIQEQLLYGE